MSHPVPDQLDKVLALADSAHEGEAAAAVRKARQMLSRNGLSFGDLARAASNYKPRAASPFSFFSGQQANMEMQIVQLRQKLDDVIAEKQAQDVQLDFWRRRAADLEDNLNIHRAEAERWRTLARETVEKLWA